jgi:hypothetical protein
MGVLVLAAVLVAAALGALAAVAAAVHLYLEVLLRYDDRGTRLAVRAGVWGAGRRFRVTFVDLEPRPRRTAPVVELPWRLRRWALALVHPLPRPLRRVARRALRAVGWRRRPGLVARLLRLIIPPGAMRRPGAGRRRGAVRRRGAARRRAGVVRRARAAFARAARARRLLGELGARVRWIDLDAAVRVGTGDAASTGTLVGALWAVTGPLAAALRAALPVRRAVVTATPSFHTAALAVEARCILHWRGGDIISAAWHARRARRAPETTGSRRRARGAKKRRGFGWPTTPSRA